MYGVTVEYAVRILFKWWVIASALYGAQLARFSCFCDCCTRGLCRGDCSGATITMSQRNDGIPAQ
jgi:hypothetical protein